MQDLRCHPAPCRARPSPPALRALRQGALRRLLRVALAAALLVTVASCGSSLTRSAPGALNADASSIDPGVNAQPTMSGAVTGGDGAPDGGDASGPPPAPDGGGSGFVHPGVLVDAGRLAFVKGKVAAGAEPWATALAAAKASRIGALTYVPRPRAIVECGSYSNPDIGCTDEKDDAMAAYTEAVLYVLTGEEERATKAAEILDAWSAVLTDHTNANAPLQAAWVASDLARAGEILRSAYAGWDPASVARFGALLKNVYLPKVKDGAPGYNGNWELSMTEAILGIAVFLDDRALFDHGVALWRRRVPAYLYRTADGPLPVPPPGGQKDAKDALVAYWYGQSTFSDGLCQETCRDLGHVQYGLAAMLNGAATAQIQGVDLFAAEGPRLAAALEFHAALLRGAIPPASLCGGTLNAVKPAPMWELAHSLLGDGHGAALPETTALLATVRPTKADHHMVWETLTHADGAL